MPMTLKNLARVIAIIALAAIFVALIRRENDKARQPPHRTPIVRPR